MNAVILYITLQGNYVKGKWYKYRDTILSMPNTDDGKFTITYDGQEKRSHYDGVLQNDKITTYLVVRNKRTDEFAYVGRVTKRQVMIERTSETPLQMQFTIDTRPGDYEWSKNGHVFQPVKISEGKNNGKYKNGVIVGMNAQMIKRKYVEGIIPVRI